MSIKRRGNREKLQADKELQVIFLSFRNAMKDCEDLLLEKEGYEVFRKYHELWKRKAENLNKKFRIFKVDHKLFTAVVTHNLLEHYYGVQVPYSKILDNYEPHPNNVALRCI